MLVDGSLVGGWVDACMHAWMGKWDLMVSY